VTTFACHSAIFFNQEILIKSRVHDEQTSKTVGHFDEENKLWIGIIDSITEDEAKDLYGDFYGFYSNTADFLNKTPYRNSYEHCLFKKDKILDLLKVSVIIPFFNRVNLTINAIKSVLDAVKSVVDAIGAIISAITKIIADAIKQITDLIASIIDAAGKFIDGIIDAIASIFDGIEGGRPSNCGLSLGVSVGGTSFGIATAPGA
jgi:hypothetical protein